MGIQTAQGGYATTYACGLRKRALCSIYSIGPLIEQTGDSAYRILKTGII